MKDDWKYIRRQCDHFTGEEIEYIERSFHDGVKATVVARKLQCSSRVIYTRYSWMRGTVRTFSEPKKKIERPVKRPIVDKASRFYRSNFEPT